MVELDELAKKLQICVIRFEATQRDLQREVQRQERHDRLIQEKERQRLN